MKGERPGYRTRAVHGSRLAGDGPLSTPVHHASTYGFKKLSDLADANAGRARADSFYSRYGNVNTTSVEDHVASLEGAEGALLFASGMAAISAVLFTFLRPGARLLAISELYGGTIACVRDVLVPWGVEAVLIDLDDRSRFEDEARRGAAMIYVESPTNPLCRIAELPWFSRLATGSGALLVCDATFASPVNQETLQLGADLVVQSATKLLGGHSDLLAGTVAGARRLLSPLEHYRRCTGAVADPEQAWRLERSLKTLPLRVEAQNASALAIARHLETRQEVERVHYPGLPSHRDHALAARQMRGFGNVVTFDLRGGEAAASRFVEALERFALAPSLGGVESLVSPPALTSHASVPAVERERIGVRAGSLRLSVGVEDVEDLLADLDRAFNALA